MSHVLLRAVTAIQLTRLTLAFGAISDIWLVILLSRALQPELAEPVTITWLPMSLLMGAVIAIGLYAHGTALNDILDVRHDTAFSPDRPIPAGRIRVGQAAVLAVGSLILSILAAASFGVWPVCVALLAATSLLFFNAVSKYIPAIGLMTVGFIHATTMLIPNLRLEFLLPVWLSMTHAMLIAAFVHVLEDKRPRFRARAVVASIAGWALLSGGILGWMWWRVGGLWPSGVPLWNVGYPVIAVLGFAVIARWKTRGGNGLVAAEKARRYGAMWQSLYAAAWLAALQLHVEALWMSVFAVSGFTVMTILREITGLSGRPIAYR